MEIFLYGCEICNNVVYVEEDCGNSHLHACKSCSGGVFHKKIVIALSYDMFGVFQGSRFVLQEKKEGDTKE